MKTTKTPLTQIKPNPGNPRTISPENLELLINSILEFPRMLEIRPIVTDKDGMILGGNMRYKALMVIAGMSVDEIIDRISHLRSSESKTEDEIRKCTTFWIEWLKSPYSHVVDASTLTEADKQAFVVKDNVNFGQWDWDALENFTQEELQDWGVQTWGALEPITTASTAPDPLPGAADNRERIIVIFPRERRAEVERMLRLAGLPQKQVYRIDELINRPADE
ncbi:MAG: ParB N-terminal domain-containing protein [Muribaculaceae bacterium]|nr:ParB N-terminal domain-containing protein [Muribaculaceae bacterium]